MPMVAAAAGAAVSWVTTAVASAGALMTSSFSAYAGLSVGTAAAITNAVGSLVLSAGLSAATTALMAPRTGGGGSPTSFKADPSAPISGVMGRFGVGGRQVHMRTWGKENLLITYFTVLSLGPIQGVQSFTANGLNVTFPGPQGLAANVEPYKDKMWMQYRDGLPSDTAFTLPSLSVGSPAMSPAWTSAHKFSGYAASMWTMQNNSKRASYENGVPRPLWTLHGMKLWDPRFDSTYPGGSGPQRRDNWTTWAYTENPYVHALAWVRGHHKNLMTGLIDRSKRLAGVGAPDDAIDIAAFVEGANVADANGWKIAGEWTTADDKWNVLAAMLQAGGGVPLNRGAQISCMVNAPRASLMTLTGADLAGPVSLKVMASRRDRFNTIIPRYRDESQKWEEVAAGPVTSSTYVTEDRGEPRTREISYLYVRQAKQAAELGAYDLANARESLTGTLPSKPYLLNLRAGDAFTVAEPELGLNGQKFLVLKRGFDPASAVVTLEVRSETDAKHAWALGQTANAPPSPSLTAPDLVPDAPEAGSWTLSSEVFTDGGTAVPALVVIGSALDGAADQVIFEFRVAGVTEWTAVSIDSADVVRKEISGLTNGTQYEVAVSYKFRNQIGPRLVIGPVTAGSSDATYGSALNRVKFADFERGWQGWSPRLNTTGVTPSLAAGGSAYRYIMATFTATADGQVFSLGTDPSYRFQVTPGERLSFQSRVHFEGASAQGATTLRFLNASGVEIPYDARLPISPGTIPFGVHYEIFVDVPAGAATCEIEQFVTSSGAGLVYTSLAQPMVAGANASQTLHPPFSIGPIDLTAEVQWIDKTGRIVDGRGLPINAGSGSAIVLNPTAPLTPGVPPHTSINVAATTATLVGGYTLSLPSAAVGGLSPDTVYSVFRDLTAGAWVAAATDLTPYFTDKSRYLWVGNQRTAVDSGGGYSPPPPPRPGGGGVACPQEAEMVRLANVERSGPGQLIPAKDLRVGMWVWTQHETTRAWGAFQIYALSRHKSELLRLVMHDGRAPLFSPEHPLGLAGGGFRELVALVGGELVDGLNPGIVAAVEPAGRGVVVRISVRDAATFLVADLLGHNKIPIDDF